MKDKKKKFKIFETKLNWTNCITLSIVLCKYRGFNHKLLGLSRSGIGGKRE